MLKIPQDVVSIPDTVPKLGKSMDTRIPFPV